MCVYISELCYVFHVHALALIVIPVEQHAALLPRLNPHFGSLCVKNTTVHFFVINENNNNTVLQSRRFAVDI